MKTSRRELIKRLDRIFSMYIRLKYSTGGMVRCYTCGRWYPIEQMTVGHFIKRQFSGVRYDERNVKPQCRRCNYFLQGNDVEFERRLKQEYGDHIIDLLREKKGNSLNTAELTTLIAEYSNKLKGIGCSPKAYSNNNESKDAKER